MLMGQNVYPYVTRPYASMLSEPPSVTAYSIAIVLAVILPKMSMAIPLQ